MEDQKQHNERVKWDIDELKGSVSMIMEMLKTLMIIEAQPLRTIISEINSGVVDPRPFQKPITSC